MDPIYEVIDGDGMRAYYGNNWVQALGAYHLASLQRQHVMLWEGTDIVREYHPKLGELN